jgi:hypothetical protein
MSLSKGKYSMTVELIEIIKKVHHRISYAEEDLRFAEHGLTISSSCPYRLIAYHAQQCAEKCLKGYWMLRDVMIVIFKEKNE